MRYSIFILLTLFCMNDSYCQDSVQTLAFGNGYEISLPDFFTEFPIDSNTNRVLAYGNTVKVFHLVVGKESKEEGSKMDLESYSDKLAEGSAKTLKNSSKSSFRKTKINGIKMLRGGLRGNHEDADLFFYILVFEDKTDFYRVFLWTDWEKTSNYQKCVEEIFNSIRHIN